MKKNFIHDQVFSGFFFTFVAFLVWGLLPVYWAMLFYLPAPVIVGYRVVFSFIFVLAVVLATGGSRQVVKICRDRRSLFLLSFCGILIGANWTVYMFAITSGHVMEASMGYYMNPLVSAILGIFVFKESLRSMQIIAMLLMLIGVAYMIAGYGHLPLYGLSVAVTFALYGALHKMLKVKVLPGMVFETLVLIIPAVICLIRMPYGGNFFSQSTGMQFMLTLAGPLTILPLLGYAFGIQRLRLVTVGVVQYISPTATFLLGIFYFHEGFTTELLIVFGFIWLGVLCYVSDGIIQNRLQTRYKNLQKRAAVS